MDKFNCDNCQKEIKTTGFIGTKNRNHCPFCLYSKHVDIKPGDRKETCQGLMQPIGLTFKHEGEGKQGEIMLVHKCLVCNKESFNRIAADDDPLKILSLAKDNQIEEIKKQLFGKDGLEKLINYQNIAISGEIGSGKTSLAKNLAKILGWQYLSAGDFFRAWHKQNNIALEEAEKVPENIDKKVDHDFKTQMENNKNFVFESHLADFLAKDLTDTYKILIVADFDKRMERVAQRENVPLKKVCEESEERSKSLVEKFKKLYGVQDQFDKNYFNLIIDSTNKNQNEVLEEALEGLLSSFISSYSWHS